MPKNTLRKNHTVDGKECLSHWKWMKNLATVWYVCAIDILEIDASPNSIHFLSDTLYNFFFFI